MAVVAADEDRCVAGDRVNYLPGWEFGGSPLGFIPVAAEDPRSLGSHFGALADAAHELLGTGGVIQLHGVQLRAAADEVHMRVIEAGEEQLSACIDDLGLRTAPGGD